MKKMFCIKDTKVGAFLTPFTASHVSEAVRAIIRDVKRARESSIPSNLAEFPGDFELWILANFNEVSGEIENSCGCIDNVASILESLNPSKAVENG